MKKVVVIIVLVLISSIGYAQSMPIDFSSNEDDFSVFSGTTFSITNDPTDNSNAVGRFFNNGNAEWQGFYLDMDSEVDLVIRQEITLRFYSFDLDPHTVMVKLDNGDNPDVEVVQTTPALTSVGWQDLSFDFTNAQLSDGSGTTNASGTYSRLTIFINGGETVSGIYLIDDINDGSEAVDPHELDIIYSDLVWSDEFDTNGAVDDTKWHHQTFGPVGGGWFNGEQQHYTDRLDNSFVQDGFLHIVAKREAINLNGINRDYTSARLNSKFAFTYGRVDVRAKLPFGDGTWPAIWTLGKNISEPGAWFQTQGYGTTPWPACGELDIMEHGIHDLNEISAAIHTPSSHGSTINIGKKRLADVANTYHVYSMNWSPNQITYMVDGVGYYTYKPSVQNNDTWPFDLDQYLLLNIAMGGIGGTIDPNFMESSMIIDYVRVYQNTTANTEDIFADKFTVFPNPSDTTSLINIQATEKIDTIEVYNTLGRLIQRKTSNTNQLNVNYAASGVYFIKIYSGNKMVTKKVILK